MSDVVAADPDATTSGIISGILVNLGRSLNDRSSATSSSSVSDESVSPCDSLRLSFSGSSSGVVSDGEKCRKQL